MLVDDHEIILVRGLLYYYKVTVSLSVGLTLGHSDFYETVFRAGMCENICRRVPSREFGCVPMTGVVESGSCTPPALELRVTLTWPELIVED